jgi:hypothetical protein
LAAAAVLWAPAAASGQQTEQELVQRLDELIPLIEQAKVEAEEAKARRRRELEAKQPTEAFAVGLLHVLVPPGASDAARDVIGTVWTHDYAGVIDRSPSLARDRIYFDWSADLATYRPTAMGVRKVQNGLWRSRSYVEREVRHAVGESLKDDLLSSPTVGRWGIEAIRPPENPQNLYKQVALAPSRAAHACLDGEAAQCLVMVGLIGGGDPFGDLYTPGERRLLVLRQDTRFGAYSEGLAECRDGSTDACDTIVRSYIERWGSATWAIPVLPDVRTSLLWYALQRGGHGAWGRLLEHMNDETLVALEAASGLDADALASGWQAWLMAQHPTSHAGVGSLALGALFWTLLSLTFALRSTRWRLG